MLEFKSNPFALCSGLGFKVPGLWKYLEIVYAIIERI